MTDVYILDPRLYSPEYDRAIALAIGGNATATVVHRASEYADDIFERSPCVRHAAIRSPRTLPRSLRALASQAAAYGLVARSEPAVVSLQWAIGPVFDELHVRRLRRGGHLVSMTLHNVGRAAALGARPQIRAAQASDCVVVHTEEARQALHGLIAPEKVFVVPHPVLPLLSGVATHAQTANHGTPMISFVGGGGRYKGIDTLLDALTGDLRPSSELRVLLAGNLHLSSDERERCDQLGVEVVDRWLDIDEYERILVASSVIVFPYTAVSQSGALLKAIGAGAVVACSDLPPFREVLDEHGMAACAFRPGDMNGLHDLLLSLVGDVEARCRARTALDAARARLSLEVCAERYATIWGLR